MPKNTKAVSLVYDICDAIACLLPPSAKPGRTIRRSHKVQPVMIPQCLVHSVLSAVQFIADTLGATNRKICVGVGVVPQQMALANDSLYDIWMSLCESADNEKCRGNAVFCKKGQNPRCPIWFWSIVEREIDPRC